MSLQPTPYTPFLVIEAGVLFGLGVFFLRLWRRERIQVTATAALIMLTSAVWVVGYTLSLSSTTIVGKRTWYLLEYFGLALVPTLWLIYVLQYTRRDAWLTKPIYVGLGVPPAIFIALTNTTTLHGLVITDITLTRIDGIVVGIPDFGTAYWLFIGYIYLQIAVVMALLLYSIIDSRGFHRLQAGVLFASSSVIPLTGVIEILELDPLPTLDAAVVSLIAIAIPPMLTLYDRRFMRSVPVANAVVIQELDDPVFVIDRRGRLVDLNPAAESLTGIERYDAIDMPIQAVLPDLVTGESTPIDTTTFTDEIELSTAGTTRHFDINLTTVSSGGFVVILREITERRERERELQRQNERLDEFASVVAHDLRNPLNVASGSVELAHEADEPGEHLERVERATDRMERIVEDLLELARDGQAATATETLDLRTVVQRAWETVETPTATLELDDDLPTVTGTPGRLEELFENLFRNAVEHGGADVTIRVGTLEGSGFYVADDGPGVAPEDREEIFDHGYTSKDTGTGLGLSIVSDIAAAHGWSVEITEASDGGARFEFRPT